MGQQVEIMIKYAHCGHIYKTKVFRTIWGEYPCLRNKVLNNQINIVTYPICKTSFHTYVDVNKQFAVWWGPKLDNSINQDIQEYIHLLKKNNLYQQAPSMLIGMNLKIPLKNIILANKLALITYYQNNKKMLQQKKIETPINNKLKKSKKKTFSYLKFFLSLTKISILDTFCFRSYQLIV